MSFIEIAGKFHIALDGVGVMLQNAPERPAYRVVDAPVYGARFASGDRDYNDLSQWWYLIQTDWSGGIKNDVSFEDDAKFYYSTNIDARTSPGKLKLEKSVTTAYDNTANDRIRDVRDHFYNQTTIPLFIDGDNVRKLSDGSLVASAGSDDVLFVLSFLNYIWLFYDGVAVNGGVSNYKTTESNKTSQLDSVVTGNVARGFGGVVIGDAMYIFVLNGSGNNRLSCIKTVVDNPTVAGDWTLVFEKRVDELSVVTGIEHLNGEIIFTLSNDSSTSINSLDISSGIVSELGSFSSDVVSSVSTGLRYVRKFKDRIIITLPYASSIYDGRIYEYDGSSLTKIFETNYDKDTVGAEASFSLYGGGVVGGDVICWGNLAYDGVSFFNLIKNSTDDATIDFFPVGYSVLNNELYFRESTNSRIIYAYNLDLDSTAFKTGASESAYLVFSQHDKLQSIDKLLNTINIGFDPLLTGQSIEVYYMDDIEPSQDIADWTLLDTADFAVDGGSVSFKRMQFPEGTANKKYWFRVNLKSTTAGTPQVTDFTLEYLPIPDYRMQWQLNINAADELKTIDGSATEMTGRELKSRLVKAWQTKSALDYQDTDFATTTLSDNPLSSSATTVAVDSTRDFPEQGRFKIENEEMFYTGKTPKSFTGVTRGARGTLAVSHVQNTVVNNGYRVLVVDIDIRIPTLFEEKNLEYILGITLREI